MEPEPKLSIAALKVLKTLLERESELYQAELAEKTAVSQASVSRVLSNLTEYGWVEGRDESVDASAVGRPARRYYRLTDAGKAYTRDALREVAIKGPLDEMDVNHEWSDEPLLNEQSPVHDYTYTVIGPAREQVCDLIWEAIEYFRTSNGFEVWNRNEVSIRVRTNTLSTIKLFLKKIDEVEAAYYDWEDIDSARVEGAKDEGQPNLLYWIKDREVN